MATSHEAALLGLLLVACIADLETRRIPNVISACLLVGGLAAQLAAAGPVGLLSGLGASLGALAILWLPWTRGWIGGGDVKVAAGAAAWLGVVALPKFLLVSALAGGGLCLAWLALSPRVARARVGRNLWSVMALREMPKVDLAQQVAAVPYCLAIAAGAVATLYIER